MPGVFCLRSELTGRRCGSAASPVRSSAICVRTCPRGPDLAAVTTHQGRIAAAGSSQASPSRARHPDSKKPRRVLSAARARPRTRGKRMSRGPLWRSAPRCPTGAGGDISSSISSRERRAFVPSVAPPSLPIQPRSPSCAELGVAPDPFAGLCTGTSTNNHHASARKRALGAQRGAGAGVCWLDLQSLHAIDSCSICLLGNNYPLTLPLCRRPVRHCRRRCLFVRASDCERQRTGTERRPHPCLATAAGRRHVHRLTSSWVRWRRRPPCLGAE